MDDNVGERRRAVRQPEAEAQAQQQQSLRNIADSLNVARETAHTLSMQSGKAARGIPSSIVSTRMLRTGACPSLQSNSGGASASSRRPSTPWTCPSASCGPSQHFDVLSLVVVMVWIRMLT